jgi:hypothetical protein
MPYRLYALSNFGSLTALISYPFLVEPRLATTQQAWIWSAGFVLFVLACGYAAYGTAKAGKSLDDQPATGRLNQRDKPGLRRRAAWIVLPALSCLMLLATTNYICLRVAAIPFLWIVPLSLYLLSYIICFDRPSWYRRVAWSATTALLVLAVASRAEWEHSLTAWTGISMGTWMRMGFYFTGMFAVCMVCHGELFRLRPSPNRLTGYYLSIAGGGAIGGILVGLVAPAVFNTYHEWPIGLAGGYLAAVIALASCFVARRRAAALICSALASIVGVAFIFQWQLDTDQHLALARSFYGVLEVNEVAVDDPLHHRFSMRSEGVLHGLQLADPDRRMTPLSYYGPETGIAQALKSLKSKSDLRIATIGLGAGTIAAFVEPGQSVCFYEINPDCERMARSVFTFLRECRGQSEVVIGDGRLSLERQPPQNYDIIVLDAFSGHAVPAHLLTREAVELYLRHLRPDGILAFNVTNEFLDLSPVLTDHAKHFELQTVRVRSRGDQDKLLQPTDWMLLTRNKSFLNEHSALAADSNSNGRKVRSWTDQCSNLFELLK